jgi:hypothetical protein
MIYGRDNSSNREGADGTEGTTGGVNESAAPAVSVASVVSDAEMAGIVRAASTLRIEAHTADLDDFADIADSVRYSTPRVPGTVRGPKDRDGRRLNKTE